MAAEAVNAFLVLRATSLQSFAHFPLQLNPLKKVVEVVESV
jgi:hypothetical protein